MKGLELQRRLNENIGSLINQTKEKRTFPHSEPEESREITLEAPPRLRKTPIHQMCPNNWKQKTPHS